MHMCLCPFLFLFICTYPYISSFINSSKSINNEHKDHKISLPDFDFKRTSYISEIDFEKDMDESDLPLKVQRFLTMEDKQILPHQEVTELVNLGTDDEKKEVKIGYP